MKKYKWNLITVLLLAMVMVAILFGIGESGDVVTSLKLIDIKWIGIGLIFVILYLGVETIIQYMLTNKMQKGNSKWNAFKVVMTGQFFNAITPFASGGQPMQAFIMSRQGVPVGISVSILMTKFIVYQIILTVYSIIVLCLQLPFFSEKVDKVIYLAVIGFTINFIIVGILLASVFMQHTLKKLGFWGVNIFTKMHMIKNPGQTKRHIIEQIDLFSSNIKLLTKNLDLLFKVSGLTIMQLTAYFMIPYVIYRAFGLDGTKIFLIISAAAFIVMISSFIPIPGGSGVAEGSFYLFFSLFFPNNILPTAILCWRLLTFYIPLCIGGIMTVLPDKKGISRVMDS